MNLKLERKTIKHWLAVVFGLPSVYQTECFAQEGEDLLITKLLENHPPGFYIDIGAHHPYRFSNTYLLYKKGWRGINIDPMPGGMSAFELSRKGDTNLELAVGESDTPLAYYQFADSALNTFDPTIAQQVIDSRQSTLQAKRAVEIKSLAEITNQWLPKDATVEFLDIDVEGSELAVLQTNDWQRVHPYLLSVEYLSTQSLAAVLESELAQYLAEKGYALHSRTVNTLLFIRQK